MKIVLEGGDIVAASPTVRERLLHSAAGGAGRATRHSVSRSAAGVPLRLHVPQLELRAWCYFWSEALFP